MSWQTATKEKGYKVIEEDLVIADSDGANVVTVKSSPIEGDLSARKVTYEVEVTDQSAANGDATISAEWSFDGSNWHSEADGDATVDTSATGITDGVINLVDIYAPYWRFSIATDGTDIQDSVDITVRTIIADILRPAF